MEEEKRKDNARNLGLGENWCNIKPETGRGDVLVPIKRSVQRITEQTFTFHQKKKLEQA